MWYITIIINSNTKSKQVYWMQNICEPQLRHSNREREDGEGKGRARRLMCYHFPFLPVPWLAGHKYVYL
jgi:hypothetical protein